MTFHIYLIEIQKPTGKVSFLKSLGNYLVVDHRRVTPTHRSEVKLFNDRTETYSYIKDVTAETNEELIHMYYELVREYRISLEYEKGEWTYLIPVRKPPQYPIAHRNPVLPNYECEKPIKFFKTPRAEDGDSDEAAREEALGNFFSEKYYTYFLMLMGRYKDITCPEAFILTLYYFYFQELPEDLENENFFYLTFINDKGFYETYEKFYCPSQETFDVYIKPLMKAPRLTPQFYSVLPDYLLAQSYCDFYLAAIEWWDRYDR